MAPAPPRGQDLISNFAFAPAQGLLQADDQVLALDGVELAGRRLAQVLQPRPTHVFKVCRHVVKC